MESQDDLAEAGDDMHVDNDMERVDDGVDEVSIRPDLKKNLAPKLCGQLFIIFIGFHNYHRRHCVVVLEQDIFS